VLLTLVSGLEASVKVVAVEDMTEVACECEWFSLEAINEFSRPAPREINLPGLT